MPNLYNGILQNRLQSVRHVIPGKSAHKLDEGNAGTPTDTGGFGELVNSTVISDCTSQKYAVFQTSFYFLEAAVTDPKYTSLISPDHKNFVQTFIEELTPILQKLPKD